MGETASGAQDWWGEAPEQPKQVRKGCRFSSFLLCAYRSACRAVSQPVTSPPRALSRTSVETSSRPREHATPRKHGSASASAHHVMPTRKSLTLANLFRLLRSLAPPPWAPLAAFAPSPLRRFAISPPYRAFINASTLRRCGVGIGRAGKSTIP